jgi:predicted O-methyltransferase YrrM
MENDQIWRNVDEYVGEVLVREPAELTNVLNANREAGLPDISVSAPQGKMLYVLAAACGAKRILEVGTLGGYSTIWLGKALPSDGKLISLEYEEKHAAVARANIKQAGLAERVEVQVGAAADSMKKMIEQREKPFDVIFIDADKEGYPQYFELSMQLVRRGSLIIADNVVRHGEVINAKSEDSRVQGIRKFNEIVSRDKRVEATAIQTVGKKGYDGLAFIVVNSGAEG